MSQHIHKIRVWDLPTRLFHWALVAAVVGLAITGTIGGNAMVWHFRFGYSVLTLLLFRIVWGLVGGRWSRFGAFIYSPASVINYLKGKGKPEHGIGHN
ncbi:MAG: cytochrome b/b6 domain-containing protein, partial [Polaromonas sp.]|nr:cytochrome b/b6 domain-containing protein [Polaromonas sp.]